MASLARSTAPDNRPATALPGGVSAILESLVTLSALPLRAVETDFAADSTGFSTWRYVRYDHKWGKEQVKREWVKLHAMVGVRTNLVTAVEMTDWQGADYKQFRRWSPPPPITSPSAT